MPDRSGLLRLTDHASEVWPRDLFCVKARTALLLGFLLSENVFTGGSLGLGIIPSISIGCTPLRRQGRWEFTTRTGEEQALAHNEAADISR